MSRTLGLLARMLLGAVLSYAGWAKLTDLTGSIQTVVAYQLFGYEVSRFIAVTLPVAEVGLAVLLLAGLATRMAGAAAALLMLVFIAGIISVWVRGISIDCGCFGNGGAIDAADTRYPQEILRDLGLFAAGVWLAGKPHTLASVDALLAKKKASSAVEEHAGKVSH